MLKFILPLILGLVGIGAGVGAGIMLKPAPTPEADAHASALGEPSAEGAGAACPPPGDMAANHTQAIDAAVLVDKEFVKLNNQFVVPIITDTRVAALVVMSLTIEVNVGNTELVYSREPKLRDLFLQTLFDQASLG
ncbi:MAG: flagellar basal body-associated protein FliL, partial [Primorskyibacter sp.]